MNMEAQIPGRKLFLTRVLEDKRALSALLMIDLFCLAATLSALYSRQSTAMAATSDNMYKVMDSADEKFTFFEESNPFSNYYERHFKVEGKVFRSVEEFFHFKKAGTYEYIVHSIVFVKSYCMEFSVFFDDKIRAAQILNSMHPLVQKRLGRQVSNIDRERWIRVSKSYMKIGCYAKVS